MGGWFTLVASGLKSDHAELGRLWHRLQPLATSEMPLDQAPPRSKRFGSPLVLSRVHWVRPELVVEVKYLTGRGITCFVRWSISMCGRRKTRARWSVPCRTKRSATEGVADGNEVTPIVSGDGSAASWTRLTATHWHTQQNPTNTGNRCAPVNGGNTPET
jgi:hypothetical protein